MELTLGFDAAWQWRSNADAPPARRARGLVRCSTASGGSKRDMQKIVARTKHRRARHMKLLNKRNLYDPVEEELVRQPHILDSSTPDGAEEDRQEKSLLDNALDEEISDEDAASDDGEDGVEESEEPEAVSSLPGDLREENEADDGEEDSEERDRLEGISSLGGDLKENVEAGAEAVSKEVSGSTPVDSSKGIKSKEHPRHDQDGKKSKEQPRHDQDGTEPKEQPRHDQGRFADLKVFVAGASGRTGRLVVEKLSKGGAKVRALCRDKANRFNEQGNVTAVRGDICKYETLKQALGDSNAVVCVIGTKFFPLDIMKTYQIEYEGVVNLISAAKNQGQVKKFILVTSIGVSSFLQIIPILWWKRQAELALQRSGLEYTIVRPAGLRENAPADEALVMRPADSLFIGGISRSKVAEVCVEAIVVPESSEKIVEICAGDVQKGSIQELFSRI
ncbi:hypothetical protein SELMODRAFT_440242 [Selaginella moellendorffii]|uniref:NAD(P)-binding domain-containing protein n=1 Tax=Selaginella moellendorffii TaxID=88036 RepID=D8RAF1_SELML|nr:uncharacterized protein LOC9631599 [Selaginella moellendorffii]EFJ30607.1 hypothetical protein SELMODRAFT_440242 [Selaginella moellendorffii]|eukprot:XP_002968353.1 uncharacterized protein LOC9631599 [Selaginella moellendorffii]